MDEKEMEQMSDALKAYKNQLDALKNDLEIVIRMANPHLTGRVQVTVGHASRIRLQ